MIIILYIHAAKNELCSQQKPSSGNDSKVGHGFRAKPSLSLTKNTPALSYNTTILC